MKARQLAAMLTALAPVADSARAAELRQLANFFASGNDDTVAARLKKMPAARSHPAILKQALEQIHKALEAAGAKKQAATLATLLGVFTGQGGASVETFIQEISVPPPAPRPQRTARAAKPAPSLDYQLARTLADRLTETTLDTNAFNEVVQELRSAKLVNTPTLIGIAHRYLGNSEPYTGRKTAIEDIVRRQKSEVREYARGKALSRVGV